MFFLSLHYCIPFSIFFYIHTFHCLPGLYLNCPELSNPSFSVNSIDHKGAIVQYMALQRCMVAGYLDLKEWSEQKTIAFDSISFYDCIN